VSTALEYLTAVLGLWLIAEVSIFATVERARVPA
jgi:hypothetical protein